MKFSQKTVGLVLVSLLSVSAWAQEDQSSAKPVNAMKPAVQSQQVQLSSATLAVMEEVKNALGQGDVQNAISILEETLSRTKVSGVYGDYFAMQMAQIQLMNKARDYDSVAARYREWMAATRSEYVADQFANWSLDDSRVAYRVNAIATARAAKDASSDRSLARLLVGDLRARLQRGESEGFDDAMKQAVQQIAQSGAELSKHVLMDLWAFAWNTEAMPTRQLDVTRLIFRDLGKDQVDLKFLLTLAVLEEQAGNEPEARNALNLALPRISIDDVDSLARWYWSSANVHYLAKDYQRAMADLRVLEAMATTMPVNIGIDVMSESGILKQIMDGEFQERYGMSLIPDPETPAKDVETVSQSK